MKPLFKTRITVAAAAIAATFCSAVQAAPRQMVVVVAEGMNPQTLDIGSRYVNKAADADDASGLATLKAQGTSATVANPMDSVKGLLASAKASGYRTGLITTGDVSKVAPLLNGSDEAQGAELVASVPFNVLAGGGRAAISAEQRTALGRTNTLFETGEAFEQADAQIKGNLLSLQSDAELSYAIDRDSQQEAGLADMASFAMDTLAGANNAPFVLVVHDTLLQKALAAKDTPAAFEQIKELDSIVTDALARRGEANNLAIAVLAGGGTTAPKAAGDESNALFVVSGLQKSYTGAGTYLKGADAERITQFAEQDYPGWAVTEAQRRALIAGTLEGEAAVRASYEPVININFDTVESTPTLYALGVPADLAAITTFVTTRPAARCSV